MPSEKNENGLITIDAPHFYAAVEITDGRVTKAAPILKWMMGAPVVKIFKVCRDKGWIANASWEKAA